MRIGKATTLAPPVFRLAGLHPNVPRLGAVSSSVLEAGVLAQMLNSCRPGRTPKITASLARRLVRLTTQQKPANATHWSTRSMARAVGISEASVRRIWHSHGLKLFSTGPIRHCYNHYRARRTARCINGREHPVERHRLKPLFVSSDPVFYVVSIIRMSIIRGLFVIKSEYGDACRDTTDSCI